jgi:hypothetical protein
MAKTKRQAKDADRWVVANAPKPATPGMVCTRCGAGLLSASDIPDHNNDVHLAGGR